MSILFCWLVVVFVDKLCLSINILIASLEAKLQLRCDRIFVQLSVIFLISLTLEIVINIFNLFDILKISIF